MKVLIDMSEEFYNMIVNDEFNDIRNVELEHIDLVQKIKKGTSIPEDATNREVFYKVFSIIKNDKKCPLKVFPFFNEGKETKVLTLDWNWWYEFYKEGE